MQKNILIFLIAAALVHAIVRSLNRSRPTWWRHLQGRQKLLGDRRSWDFALSEKPAVLRTRR